MALYRRPSYGDLRYRGLSDADAQRELERDTILWEQEQHQQELIKLKEEELKVNQQRLEEEHKYYEDMKRQREREQEEIRRENQYHYSNNSKSNSNNIECDYKSPLTIKDIIYNLCIYGYAPALVIEFIAYCNVESMSPGTFMLCVAITTILLFVGIFSSL